MHAQRHLEAFPVHHRNPDVPEKFSYLIEKLMSKNPERRYPSAQAVREELQAWCPSEGEKPMDQSGDPNFQAAVAELEKAPVPSDEIAEEPVLPIVEEPEPPPVKQRRWLDLFVGFWAMLVRLFSASDQSWPFARELEVSCPYKTKPGPALLAHLVAGVLTKQHRTCSRTSIAAHPASHCNSEPAAEEKLLIRADSFDSFASAKSISQCVPRLPRQMISAVRVPAVAPKFSESNVYGL